MQMFVSLETVVISVVIVRFLLTLWTAVAVVSSRRDFWRPNLANKRRTLHLENIAHSSYRYNKTSLMYMQCQIKENKR